MAVMAFVLSFVFGALLSAFVPVAAFLGVVALASTASLSIAVWQGDALLGMLPEVVVEVACAQIGYVIGLAALALITQAKARVVTSPRPTERQEIGHDET